MTRLHPAWMIAGAGLAMLATLGLFWPGIAMYDTVAQYGQVLDGVYDDWHPPVMARLWSLFGAGGTAPLFVIQVALYWLGLGLISAALAGVGRGVAALGVIAIGIWPPLLGWDAVVLKDAQMLGALLAATGIVVWWRLRGEVLPWLALGAVTVLMAYATLVRANAVFAVVPLAAALATWPRRAGAKVGIAVMGVAVVLVVAPAINHGLFRAKASGVERTEALYDLAGIAVRTGDARIGLPRANVAILRARGCVRAFFWDPLGDPAGCDDVVDPLRQMAVGRLYATLAGAVVAHPLAYAAHRLAHLNSTERWLVPARLPSATPPQGSEPNALGLGTPGRAAVAWQRLAGSLIEWPLCWPVMWTAIAAIALVTARGMRRTAARDLAMALFVSALALEASFVVFSIASDLRYHLWPMTATALGVVLLPEAVWPAGRGRIGVGVALAMVVPGGTAARLTLPVPPQTYDVMLQTPSAAPHEGP